MEKEKSQVLQRLKDANNVLVTVSQNPSVDQLAAAIGMTLVLNKMGKHGTAVFSGAVPSTIEFLKPEETLEKTTDSLRDFIIALDKSKADKLRYKVEDQHVKIFITPYRTTIGQEDLEFSHGDFNVDAVLALGVKQQTDLDQAITAHGRILHDATVIAVNTTEGSELGGINLNIPNSSSLSEILADLSQELKSDVFDEQISTAYLTGIVAETDRFSNEKTKPTTMSISAKLMANGANQQLVATELQQPEQPIENPAPPEQNSQQETENNQEAKKSDDGSLEINHNEQQDSHKIHIDEHGNMKPHNEDKQPQEDNSQSENSEKEPEKQEEEQKAEKEEPSRMIFEPPSMSGTLTASGKGEQLEPSTDPLSENNEKQGPMLSHRSVGEPEYTYDSSKALKEERTQKQPQTDDSQDQKDNNQDEQKENTAAESTQPEVSEKTIHDNQTLAQLEEAVDSPHTKQEPAQEQVQDNPNEEKAEAPDIDQLKNAVDSALAANPDSQPLEPIEALNANPVNLDLGHDQQNPDGQQKTNEDDYFDVSKLDIESGLPQSQPAPPSQPSGPTAPPPPVPPPMMPPSSPDDEDISLPPVNQ